MQKHNFNAGPSILPREVIEKTAQAILDYNGSGLSLMEISHRAKDFQPVVDEARINYSVCRLHLGQLYLGTGRIVIADMSSRLLEHCLTGSMRRQNACC